MENDSSLTKADLKAALTELRNEFKADLWTLEQRLMQHYGKSQQVRLHSLEKCEAVVIERLAITEERLLNLETHRPPSI